MDQARLERGTQLTRLGGTGCGTRWHMPILGLEEVGESPG